MKCCARCHIEKSESEFQKSKQQTSGLFPYCRQCCREKSTEYRRKNGIPPLKRREELKPLPTNKVCSCCEIDKPKECFRVRVEDKKYRYLNSTCKECDAALARTRWSVFRQTPEGRKRNCESARRSYRKRRERVIAQMKEKRKTPEYKKMMKEYRERNKDKIYQQEVITKKRYHEKHRDAVTDRYVISQLRNQKIIEKDFVPTPELIEAKRLQLLIKRKIKHHGDDN